MSPTIISIAPSYGYISIAFYAMCAIFFGTTTYVLMRKPNFRSEPARSLTGGGTSTKAAAICSLLVALPFLIYGYIVSWMYFYDISIINNKLLITYLYPTRTYENEISAVKLSKEIFVSKGFHYRIVITDPEGAVYESQLLNKKQADESFASLQNVIGNHVVP